MSVKGNWGVEIIDSIGVYENPQKKHLPYLHDRIGDYKSGCGC